MTLLEIVLAMSLMIALAAVAAVGLGRRPRREFLEAAGRFETLLRVARAEAANTGRRLQVSFGDEGDSDSPAAARVLWEPDPLTDPGRFVDYSMATWASYVPADDVRLLRCRLLGPSAYRTMARRLGEQEDPDELQSVMFYPDGSCDSAILELAPPDEADPLRAAIRVDGLNGTIVRFVVTEDELEENRLLIEQGLYEGPAEPGDDVE